MCRWVLSFKPRISGSYPLIVTRLSLFRVWQEAPLWLCCKPESLVFINPHRLPVTFCRHRPVPVSPTTELSAFSWTHSALSHFCVFLFLFSMECSFHSFLCLLILFIPQPQLKCYFSYKTFPCFSIQNNGSLCSHTSWYYAFVGIKCSLE